MSDYIMFSNKEYRNYFYLAILIYIVAAYFNIGHNTGDSYSQIFEFAGYKLGFINETLLRQWEFHSAFRSSLEVGILYWVYKLCDLISYPANPFSVAFIIRLLCGALSLFSIVIFTEVFAPRIKSPTYQKLFIILNLFTSLIIYTSIHYNSENIAGRLLLIALSMLFIDKYCDSLKYLAIGVLLGIVFTVRFQMGIAIVGIITWLLIIKRLEFKYIVLLCVALLISILIFNVLIDYWFYQKWTLSAYNYFYQNLVLGKVNGFSVSPWYIYPVMAAGYLPFGPIYVIACAIYIYKNPKDILSFTMIPFIVVHSLIGHKEIRFLMPILYILPFCTIWVWEYLSPNLPSKAKAMNILVKTLWTINIIFYIGLLFPASTELPSWNYIYTHYHQPTLYFYTHDVNKRDTFYTRHNLQTIPIKDVSQIKCDPKKNCLYGTENYLTPVNNQYKLVYALLPKPFDHFILFKSIGHINVYELNNVESLNKY